MEALRTELELEAQAHELAEKALAGLDESVRASKFASVKESLLHRLRSKVAASAQAIGSSSSVPASQEQGAPVPQQVAPSMPTAVDPLQLPAEEGVELFGDEHWFLDEQVLQMQRGQVVAAHAEQKIMVGPPADEIKRICPGPNRILGAGAVLRLGGSHHGGYGEADIGYAYRQLSRALHPDKNPNIPEATDAFKRLREASDELRKLLEDSRTVLKVLCDTRRFVPSAEMLERPQGPLVAEALRVLAVILGLSGEGTLPEGAVALASSSWNRFDACGRDILSSWYDSEELIQLYASAPLRTAYDCARKCYRAQFICALSRAAQAEAIRNEGCVRGTWHAVLNQFPEVGLWRGFLDKLKMRVWAADRKRRASKWDDCSGPQASIWGHQWRSVISEVLPPGPEDPAPTTDKDTRHLAAVLWREVAAWAEGEGEAQRELQLFRGDSGPEWAFLPATDLLLTVGEGIVGVTAKGFVGGAGLRRALRGALRRARAAAEAERVEKAAAERQPRKRRKVSETPTPYVLVISASNPCKMEGKIECAIMDEARQYGSLTRCTVVPDEPASSQHSIALEFERTSDAKNAINMLKDKEFEGLKVHADFLQKEVFESLNAETHGTPTKILLLRNLAGRGDAVDLDLEAKILEEARKFGRVRKCVVKEAGDAAEDGSLRVFLAFRLALDATAALADYHGKLRNGRAIRASFFDEERFKKEDLD